MAGLGGLPYFIQYQGQLQAQEQAKQQQQMQLMQFQQAQQDRQRQQAAMAAAGNALPQLLAGGQVAQQPQMPPPPQPPAPGQASQPMQQAGGGAPLPQGPVPGQMQRPLLPPGGAQGAMPPAGVPPFRPMPTTPPPQQAPQTAIPAPPAAAPQQPQAPSGPLSIQGAIKVLQDQGLSGADLMAGLAQLQPLLDTQAKMQSAQLQQQFTNELKLQTLQERHYEAQQRSEDRKLDREARVQAAAEARQLRLLIAGMKAGGGAASVPVPNIAPDTSGNLPPAKSVGGYSADAIDSMAKAYAQGNTSVVSGLGRNKGDRDARAEVISRASAYQKAEGGDMAAAPAEYKANVSAARVNANQAAKVDAAANALTQQGGIGDQYIETMDALNRTGVPIANQAQMTYLRQTFDPRVAAYDQATNGVVSELAQILGRGQVTVNSMEEARLRVEKWSTSAQARAGIAQAKKEAATTVKASREEVKRSAHGGRPEPATKRPAVGTVESGYRFKGGDPASPSSWERVQ